MGNINSALRAVCNYEDNAEKNIDIEYRNAIRLLLLDAYNRQNVNDLTAEELRCRDSTGTIYRYIFGEHPAENENVALFSESVHDDANAEIKANNTTEQFYNYIHGYREAADVLVMNTMVRGNQGYRDESVFPICFLYRQYLELSLKDMYLYYSADFETDKNDYIKKGGHGLLHIWENKIMPMIKPLQENQYQIDELNMIDGYINEFHNLDSTSMMFRYPINKERLPFHTSSRKINIVSLMNNMNKVERFLAFTSALLDVEKIRREERINREEALSHIENGNFEEALKSYNKALEICLLCRGEEHSDTVFFFTEISSVYIMQGKLEQAMELLTKALDMSNRIQSTKFLFFIYQNMGMVSSMMKNNIEALKAFEASIDYGVEDDPLLIKSYLYSARENRKIGNIEQAKMYYEKAIFLCKELLGENHDDYMKLITENSTFLDKSTI